MILSKHLEPAVQDTRRVATFCPVQAAAKAKGVGVVVFEAVSPPQIDAAFAAKAPGLTFPPSVLVQATKVIE